MNKLKKTILIIIAIVSVVFVSIVFRFGTALVQEKNPVPILSSIFALDLSGDDYKNFSTTDNHERFVSKNMSSEQLDIICTYMEEKGWVFDQQFGSSLNFVKDGEEVIVDTELYSETYIIWNVPKKVFEEQKS